MCRICEEPCWRDGSSGAECAVPDETWEREMAELDDWEDYEIRPGVDYGDTLVDPTDPTPPGGTDG